jgi:hypothetical protein
LFRHWPWPRWTLPVFAPLSGSQRLPAQVGCRCLHRQASSSVCIRPVSRICISTSCFHYDGWAVSWLEPQEILSRGVSRSGKRISTLFFRRFRRSWLRFSVD